MYSRLQWYIQQETIDVQRVVTPLMTNDRRQVMYLGGVLLLLTTKVHYNNCKLLFFLYSVTCSNSSHEYRSEVRSRPAIKTEVCMH